MSEQRAILVSREQRDVIKRKHAMWFATGVPMNSEAEIVDAFDAAVDQSCIRWCVVHGRPMPFNGERCTLDVVPCRVVDAIVVATED